MGRPPNEDANCLLRRLNAGKVDGLDRIMEAVYGELRAKAQRRMDRVFGRGQFFAIAGKLTIRILLDRHRRRKVASVSVQRFGNREDRQEQCED